MVVIPDAASGLFLHEGSLNWRVVLFKATPMTLILSVISRDGLIIEDITVDTVTNCQEMIEVIEGIDWKLSSVLISVKTMFLPHYT